MPVAVLIVGTIFGILGGVAVLSLVFWFKLKKKELEMQGSNAELGPVVDALRDDLADMQERLDFAERLLTAGREDKSG